MQDVISPTDNPCPQYLRKLVGELSRPTPTCGFIQIKGDDTVLHIVANCDNSNFQRIIFDNITELKKSCSLLLDFLLAEDIQPPLKIRLMKSLLKSVNAPFVNKEIPLPHLYTDKPESESPLAFFPNHHRIRGKANYEADSRRDAVSNVCRKQSQRAPRLNPGVFTVYCQHRICIGFQLMTDAESPRTPFEIFTERLKKNAFKHHL